MELHIFLYILGKGAAQVEEVPALVHQSGSCSTVVRGIKPLADVS